MAATIKHQSNRINELDESNSKLSLNIGIYEGLVNDSKIQKVALQFDISQYRKSNDSLILRIKDVEKEMNLSDKKLKYVSSVNVSLLDSLKFTKKIIYNNPPVNITDCDFAITERFNAETYITLFVDSGIPTIIPDISNTQTIMLHEDWEYEVSGFFRRLFKFNWRKNHFRDINIHNSNDLIRVTSTRVLEIE